MSLPAPFDIGSAGANQMAEAAVAEAAGCHGDVQQTVSLPVLFHMDTIEHRTTANKQMVYAAADNILKTTVPYHQVTKLLLSTASC